MSGVAVIRYLLANAAAVTAVVPATRIMAGDLPLKIVLPAIGVTLISGVPRLTVSMLETPRMQTDRVQVTVLFKGPYGTPQGDGYPGVHNMLALVLAACPNQHGTVNGVVVDSILPDVEGPDLQNMETDIYGCSRDFIVKWNSA